MRPLMCSAVAFLSAATVGAALVGGSPLISPTAAAHRVSDGGESVSAESQGRFDQPYSRFAGASTVLRDSSPAGAGLDARPIDDALAQIAGWEEPSGTTHPLYAGAVTLLGHNGRVVVRRASGFALRYADGEGAELPRDQWVPMREDTIFDMASVTKLFTSILVMQEVERGAIRLEEPVATYLPAFAANGKGTITVRQLLTHTSGLKPWMPLWSDWPDKRSRLAAVLDVSPTSPPGATYVYSDLNLITLGVLLERQTGKVLDCLVRERITAPLSLKDTGYNPDPSLRPRIAATEFQSSPPRGLVRGEVHDENAWSLGGVAGHAGIFSTAQDMAVLAQSMLNGGTYGGHRILSQGTVEKMITNQNSHIGAFPDDSHGLGFELDQRWYMGGLSSPTTAGHTGFTGTSIVIDSMSRSFAIVLSNRVHPSRSWGSNNPARRAAVQGLALALGVQPRHGGTAWFSGTTDATTSTLTTPTLDVPSQASVAFDLFVDTESTDPLTLESSTDGGATWAPVPFKVRDRGGVTGDVAAAGAAIATSGTRRWLQARAALSVGPQRLRWRYTTNEKYVGRGVFVDGVRVSGQGGVVLDGERHPEALVAQGWTAVRR
jgi:CubicO group peptidase (beta-lactamase class C family)